MKLRKICLAFVACAAAAQAWAYDATVEFSLAGNPNGIWTYGYSLDSGSQYAFVPFDTATDTGTTQGWTLHNYNVLNTPIVWKNTDPTNTNDGVAPGQISLHAGPNAASTAILRFTAPAAGSYNYSLQFFNGDIADTQGSVFLNGNGSTPLLSFASTSNSPSQGGVVGMGAGDTFDVAVDKVGSFLFGNTPVSLSISAVPEPATSALWLVGLPLVPFCRRRLARNRRVAVSNHFQGV